MPSLSPDARKIYGLTGGRLLDAIALNPNLKRDEKFILATIAGQMDVNGDYNEDRWLYVSDIARRTSISTRHVFRVLAQLEENGYIERQKQWEDGNNRQLASRFILTAKTFREFEALSNVRVLKKPKVASLSP